jgi:hypothetical protein
MTDDQEAGQTLRDRLTKLETKVAVIWHAGSIFAGATALFILNAVLNMIGK